MKILNSVSDLYRSPAFAIFAELYQVWKNHKKKILLIGFFELWVHGLAFHHINEFKDLLQALNPFW